MTLGAAVVAPYQLDWYVLTHPFNANVNTEGLSEALGGLIFIFAIPAYASVGPWSPRSARRTRKRPLFHRDA